MVVLPKVFELVVIAVVPDVEVKVVAEVAASFNV